jgi:tetratricopeptide (TPR) repeat protein/predicted Ser/Thr protein kinase
LGLVSGPHDDVRSSGPASGPKAELSPAEAPTVDVGSGRPRAHINAATTIDFADSTHDQDSFDDVLRRVVQTGPPAVPLAVGSELAGRFTLIRVLGQGGMGTVYVARDASLGREVAIKVHHASGGALRLRREAVAMARLAHPNVVTVFEVGEVGGRPFVVMEYVLGQTLRAWLAEAPRGVRDILAKVIAAGEGLAAAHDAGLIHRDIKPENVLISVDGRARVGDFGLARDLIISGDAREDLPTLAVGEAEAVGASADALMTPVTQTGAVLGTPAYMAPEQFAGAPVDARADQFAYCVTVWEALWQQRPFVGDSFEQLRTTLARGERRSPPTTPKVPARVRLALERGMAIDPAARFPSMHALLAAMRPPVPRRARWIAIGAAGVAIAIGAAVWPRGVAEASCANAGAAELAELRDDLPLGIAARGFADIAARANATQWRYLAGFRDHARLACEAARAHDWSPDIAARSQSCLALTGRTAALALADADPARPMDVLRRLRRLPAADPCRNQTYLASLPPIPRDPAQLAALTDARATLAVGLASVDDHERDKLAHAIGKLEAMPARTDPGIAAGLTALHALDAFNAGRITDARKLFTDAYYAGRAIDDDESATAALDFLMAYAERLSLEPTAVKDWLRTALADADRLRVRSPALASRIYVTGADAADLSQDADGALRFVARARAISAPGSQAWIHALETEGAVLMWSGKIDDGIKAYEAAIAQNTADLGPDDPEVASMLGNYASSLLDVQRLDPALAAAERAMRIINRLADPDDDRIDPIRINLAAVLLGANKKQGEAFAMLTTARGHYVQRYGETSSMVAVIDIDLALIHNDRGEYAESIARLRSALAIDEKLLGPDHAEVAVVWFNLAAAYRFAKDYPAAIQAGLTSAEITGKRSPGSDRQRLGLTMAANAANDAGSFEAALGYATSALAFTKPPEAAETTAWGQLERARALIGVHRGGEARPLLASARKTYAGLAMTARVAQCDALLGQLR